MFFCVLDPTRQCQVDLEKKVCSERADQERTQDSEENRAVARLSQHTKVGGTSPQSHRRNDDVVLNSSRCVVVW